MMGIGDMLQAEQDVEDAKRYRWLRDRVRAVYDINGEPAQIVYPRRSEPQLKGWQKRLDTAIDEQMRTEGRCQICYAENGEHQKGCVDGDAPL